MKIEIESPFTDSWRKAYLVVNSEPRRNVVLYNSPRDRTTISYARYLMSVHLGYLLDDSVVVDHINGDQMDDRLENYQLISSAENNRKRFLQSNRTRQFVEMSCGNCETIFTKPRNTTHLVIKNKKSDYCSKKCSCSPSRGLSTILREFRQ